MAAPESPPASGETVPPVPADFAAELLREDREILGPLLHRFEEIAERISEGVAIDPEYLLEGIHLWGRYVNEVHARRVRTLLRLVPQAAAGLAPAERWRFLSSRHRKAPHPGSPGGEPAPGSSADQSSSFREDQQRMAERLRVLDSLVSDYRRGQTFSRHLLASLLRSSAFVDRAWANYEEAFVGQYLTPGRSDAAAHAVEEDRTSTAELRSDVDARVREFVRRPIPIVPARVSG
jgi:transcriptional regulator with XRE-family HTH domain